MGSLAWVHKIVYSNNITVCLVADLFAGIKLNKEINIDALTQLAITHLRDINSYTYAQTFIYLN